MELDDDEEYAFGEDLPGPVLVPWYKNHGLCKSQQLVKFIFDQKSLYKRKNKDKDNTQSGGKKASKRQSGLAASSSN